MHGFHNTASICAHTMPNLRIIKNCLDVEEVSKVLRIDSRLITHPQL